jgi:hypothetical protein
VVVTKVKIYKKISLTGHTPLATSQSENDKSKTIDIENISLKIILKMILWVKHRQKIGLQKMKKVTFLG